MPISSLRPILLIALAALSLPVLADTTRTLTETFDVADLDTLELEISVAELDVEIVDGTELELEIYLEAQRRFFGLRRGSTDDIELQTRRSPSKLYIGLDERHVEQHWVLLVPRHLALSINLGVGEVNIDKLENDLEMEIGVGAVRVDIVEAAFGTIELQTGVGDAVIRGMTERADNERSFISADAYYTGTGEHHLRIDLGVGDALVRNAR